MQIFKLLTQWNNYFSCCKTAIDALEGINELEDLNVFASLSFNAFLFPA